MAKITTTIRIDAALYDRVKLFVYSRKMLDPKISISALAERALREHLDRQEQGQ